MLLSLSQLFAFEAKKQAKSVRACAAKLFLLLSLIFGDIFCFDSLCVHVSACVRAYIACIAVFVECLRIVRNAQNNNNERKKIKNENKKKKHSVLKLTAMYT